METWKAGTNGDLIKTQRGQSTGFGKNDQGAVQVAIFIGKDAKGEKTKGAKTESGNGLTALAQKEKVDCMMATAKFKRTAKNTHPSAKPLLKADAITESGERGQAFEGEEGRERVWGTKNKIEWGVQREYGWTQQACQPIRKSAKCEAKKRQHEAECR